MQAAFRNKVWYGIVRISSTISGVVEISYCIFFPKLGLGFTDCVIVLVVLLPAVVAAALALPYSFDNKQWGTGFVSQMPGNTGEGLLPSALVP